MGRGTATAEAVSVSPRRKIDWEKPKRACVHEGTIARISAKGVPARLELYSDIDDGIKPAWVVDLVELHTEKGPAGYLKIGYIPAQRLQAYYPDAFAYAVRELSQHNWQLRDQLMRPESDWSRAEYLQAFEFTTAWRTPESEKEALASASEEQLAQMWTQRREKLGASHQAEYERFIEQQVDRPYVDYIRVYDKTDNQYYKDGERFKNRSSGVSFQRQGLATLMYETAAAWLKTKGMELHASGLQSESAQGAWAQLEKRGVVSSRGKRRVLDAEKLFAETPEAKV